jgi:hypothetical protein
MRNYLVILTLLAAQAVSATTFVPVTIKKQISESQGVVKGEVSSIESFENENGEIITKIELYSDKWIGVEASESIVDVYYPGGTFGEKVQNIQGAPQVEMGENIVVLTKSINGENWIQNLGLGKFSIKRVGSNYILVNQIFPKVVNVGQIPLKKFYSLTERLKKMKFTERYKDKYELSKEKQAKIHMYKRKVNRAIASVEESEEKSEKLASFWLVLILGGLGILFGLKKKNTE